jgi:hypothetical protein
MSNEYVHKPGKGSLLSNLKREKETSPHFVGKLCLDRDVKAGDIIQVAAWKRESRLGEILSLSISRPQEKYPREVKRNNDDEIPFN